MNQDNLKRAEVVLFAARGSLLDVLNYLQDAHTLISEGEGPRQLSLTYPVYYIEQSVRDVMARVDSLREDIEGVLKGVTE